MRSIAALNDVAKAGSWKAGLLIENTAGERGDISSRIPDLAEILDGVRKPLIAGICFDTCHAFSAGYDLKDDQGIRMITEELETYMTMGSVQLIHLNDSKRGRGAGVDRHEHIGLGTIGLAGLRQFITHTAFQMIPLVLETPKQQESDDARNLRTVQKMLRLKR
jgi:deoxyribonuclease-4